MSIITKTNRLKYFKQNTPPYLTQYPPTPKRRKKRPRKIHPSISDFTIASHLGLSYNLPRQRSVLAPSVTACHALEKTRHRLISTSNLHLEKRRLLANAAFVRALRLGFLRVIPGSRPAKDVLALLALKDTPRKDRVGDGVFVGTCAALETICTVERQRDGQDICAMRTDCVAKELLVRWEKQNEMFGWCVESCAYREAWLWL